MSEYYWDTKIEYLRKTRLVKNPGWYMHQI